jgi:alpha-glucosidase
MRVGEGTSFSSAWWQTAVIYQVYPRSFRDSNGDGVGDLDGVTAQLPYLSDTLGVDALWLSPFYPSPMKDGGYDISNFVDVDPIFGDLAAFDRLIAAAHARGLRVLIDYVPNHTSDQHPWFQESRSSRDSPKRDWYIWRDAKPDGSPPNNWVEETGGSVWEWDARTRQYYLHSHYACQPDLNWRNPAVRAAMFAVLRFWMERGVDGFRVDVAHLIMKDPALRDNPPNPHARPNPYDRQHPAFHAQLHSYDRQHPDLHAVFRDVRRLLAEDDAGRERVIIGEIEVAPWEVWTRYYGTDGDEFHLPFNFQLIETPWDAVAVQAFVDAFEAALPPGAWPNYVLGNHDRPRLATRYGTEQARIAAMLLLTLRGTPTLYYGDEVGMTDVALPPGAQHDPLGRDPSRTPMRWDATAHAGFCPAGARPWLPIGPEQETRNVAAQRADERSLLTLYRHLLALRRTTPALQRGGYQAVATGAAACYGYLRSADAERRLIVLNFSAEAQRLHLAGFTSGTIVLSTALDRTGPIAGRELELRPHEGVVVDVGEQTAGDGSATGRNSAGGGTASQQGNATPQPR